MLAEVCLALAMYYEARSDGPIGMITVGQVVLNRVADPRFPKDVCSVVMQGGTKHNKCQFSFYCDGKSENPKDKLAWDMSLDLAGAMVRGEIQGKAVSQATCYHAAYAKPSWAYVLPKISRIKSHIFYRC